MSTVAEHVDRASWLEARRAGIGGSDIAALFGMHPFKTAMDVWLDKTGQAEDREPTAAMLRGRYLEPVAVQRYTERTGRRVRRAPMRQHPQHSFLLASIDRQILAGEDHGTGPLEIKCPGLQTFWQVKRGGLLDYMILQGQHEALVWGYDYTGFGIFNAENFETLSFDVPADPKVSERIIEEAGAFWEDHVLTRIPPPVEEPPAIELPEVAGEVQYRHDLEFQRIVQDYMEAHELEKEAGALKADARARAMELLGAIGTYEGGPFRVYYSMQEGRRTFQRKVLERARPVDREKLIELLVKEGLVEAEAAQALADAAALDTADFEKQGSAFKTFRPYRVKPAGEE